MRTLHKNSKDIKCVFMLRRWIASTLILLLLSITTTPLLPKQMICAHASVEKTSCDSMHQPHQNHTSSDLNMQYLSLENGHVITSSAKPSSQLYQHKILSEPEKKCRIECGCGCNRDVHGIPHLLPPHLQSEKIELPDSPCIQPTFLFKQTRPLLVSRVPIHPPQIIS